MALPSWLRIAAVSFVLTSTPMITTADEGMYLFNELPTKLLKERHDFEIDQEWADRLRLSSVRLNSGGSGSFISSNGLVLTNHHVAFDTLQKLSTPERDLIQNGFLAKSLEEELRAPDLELNQLVSIEDVTDRVNAAVPAGTSAEDAVPLRRAAMSTIEQESKDATGLRSDVVTLFGGAKYHLYRFRVFDDVRLVWAPETAAAFFGGDADNFEYPRFNIDAAILRVYENGEPAKLDNFLRWSDEPVTEGDLVFVSGHPGRTQRIFTTAALTYLRDDRIPYILNLLRRKEVLMQQYSLRGSEEKRRARDDVFGIQNSRKAYTGMQAGLLDPRVMAEKRGRESRLLAAVREREELRELASAWDEIARVQDEKRELLKQTASIRTELAEIAMQLVLLGEENLKPNDQRLREFTDASRESLLRGLLSEAPIYQDLEQFKLTDELTRLAELRGADDPLVVELLVGKGPRQRAAEMVQASKLDDPAFRKTLVDGGKTAVLASSDPLIRMARILEPEYRRLRELNERLEERERQAYAKITTATSAIEGTGGYPDATFTLRLAFGNVKSYEQDGATIPPATTFAGAFAHSESYVGPEDFQLPASWHEARSNINLDTQINFVCTADIIGGNSGSPVVNRAGELVGLIFDGNIQSLTSDYLYTDTQARAVSVAAVGIKEALRNVYGATDLLEQIGR